MDRDIIIEEDDAESLPESPTPNHPSYSPSVALTSSPSNQHHHNQQHFKETMPTHPSSKSSQRKELIEEEFEDSDDEQSELLSKHVSSTSTLISQTSSSSNMSRTPLTTADSSKSRFGLKIDIPYRDVPKDEHSWKQQQQLLSNHLHNSHLYDDEENIEELEKISTPKKGEDRSRGVHFDQTAINKEEEELFVKTLSARKHTTHHEKKPLPTTPKGENSLEDLVTLSPIGKAKFLHQDTSPKTKHFVTGSKMFHVTTEQTNVSNTSKGSLSYKNMSGVKLSKLEQIYQNYSKPLELTPHTIEESHITEKRLKKIRSSVPYHSNEIIKADVLLKEDYTHSPTSPTYQSTWTAFKEANSLPPSSLNNTVSSLNNTYQDMSFSSPKSNGSSNLSPSSHKNGSTLDSPSQHSTTSTYRASSPTNTSPPKNGSWSKFTGGFYNSPRCFNTNHKHLNDPNFLRKNANEAVPAKRIMVESEKDSPIIQKKKEEIKTMHAKSQVMPGRCSPTTRSRNNSFDEIPLKSVNSSFDKSVIVEGHFLREGPESHMQKELDELSIRAHSVISPSPLMDKQPRKEKLTADDIRKKRTQIYNDPNKMHSHSSFVTQFRPKQTKKRNPDETEEEANQRRIYQNATKKEIKVEHLTTKKANFFNFKDFDRSTMALVNTNDPALSKLFDPKNYPAEMQAQVEYFKRRRNMTKNDYQNFSPNRSQKQHTPYLYYRRNAIKQYMEFKHKLENVLGEEIPDLPHNIFKDETNNTLNVSLPSIKQKLEDHRANTSSIN